MEKALADINRLLSEHDLNSSEEINAYLEGLSGFNQVPSAAPRTPLGKAQNLIYAAWDVTGDQRIELARKALEISPDCADGYVLLAEEFTKTLEEARDLYQKGVEAGERAIGPEAFQRYAGDFWGVLETRPYMRARVGLAYMLWLLGERRQAVEHLRDMLRLNPGDNQGLRYILMGWLLSMGNDQVLGELLRQYQDDYSAIWLYTNTLWLYRQEGATPKANQALKKTLQENKLVPSYLLGREELPGQLPEYVGFGDKNEAVVYATEAIEAWRATEGALTWLAGQSDSKKTKRKRRVPRSSNPDPQMDAGQ